MKSYLSLFRNVKFNIGVFSALAIASIFGTLLPQIPENPDKVREFIQNAPQWGAFLEKSGFFNIYYSWWYVGLLGLLAFDVIVCKIIFGKFPGLDFFSKRELGSKIILTQIHQKWYEEKRTLLQVSEQLESVLRERKFKIFPQVRHESGEVAILAVKGHLQKYGSWISHISILLVLSSNLVGSLYGFREILNIPEGTSLKMQNRPWVVACDRFQVEWYKGTSTPKKFASDLRLFDRGQLAKTETTIVNEPIEHERVRFYQASYGPYLREARVGFFLRQSPKSSPTVTLRLDEDVPVPGTPYSLRILQFVPDFSLNEKREVVSQSVQPSNPALQILVLRDGKPLKAPWIFENYPMLQMPPVQKEDEFILLLADYVPAYYTGLQITYDPGADLFWIACTILVGGLMMLFYLHHRKIWIFLKENPEGISVHVGAYSSKGKSYEGEFNRLIEDFQLSKI